MRIGGKHIRKPHKHKWVDVRKIHKATRKGAEYTHTMLMRCSICGEEKQELRED